MTSTRTQIDTFQQTWDQDTQTYTVKGEPHLVRFDVYIPTNTGPKTGQGPVLHIYVSNAETYDLISHIQVDLPPASRNISTDSMHQVATRLQEHYAVEHMRQTFVTEIRDLRKQLDAALSANDPF